MSGRPKLTIAYSTLADRAGGIVFPEARPDVEILVLVQGGSPAGNNVDGRPDIRMIGLDGYGVARSRNAAIEQASGALLLFSDDDVTLIPEVFSLFFETFATHPEIALVMGQAINPDGALHKRYAARAQGLSLFNSAKAATYEMMIRLDPVRRHRVKFDEAFGAGTNNFIGDEYIFISDLLRAGLKARFIPVTIACHPPDSSGLRWSDPEAMQARRALFDRVFGHAGPIIFTLLRIRRAMRTWLSRTN